MNLCYIVLIISYKDISFGYLFKWGEYLDLIYYKFSVIFVSSVL